MPIRRSKLHHPPVRWPLQVPSRDRVSVLGVVGLRCRGPLRLETTAGDWTRLVWFVFDTGASYSLVSLALAEQRGLPVSPPDTETDFDMQTSRGVATVRVRPGRLRLYWGDPDRGYPFDWPVRFTVGTSAYATPIIGLGGGVQPCRWTFDGKPGPNAAYGTLALNDIR